MNAIHIGEDWTCETCGRHMTPHGDCPSCEKKERARAEAAGERKRAKNIVVGDIIKHPMCFKIDATEVHTVEVTPKGKVVVNWAMGHDRGEDTFWAEQWVDIVSNAPKTQEECEEWQGIKLRELLHPGSNAHPSYFWPLHYKLLYSLFLILSGLFYIFVILWLKVGAFLGVKKYKDKYVPVLFCGLVPVFHAWDKMWKENPPSHY